MKAFFDHSEPRDTLTLGDETIELPILYFRDDAFALYFSADYEKVKNNMPTDQLYPVMLPNGRAIIALAAFNYIDTTIGPYGELAVAAPAVYGKQTTASSGIFPALMESNYSGFGVVVLHLPVTHEKARDGGRVGWGYTKFIADMHFTLRPEYMQCRMLEKDTHILDLRLRRKGIYVRDRKPLTTYSVKDRQLIKTVVPQTATKRISLLTGGSYVRLGSHPMAESIKALDLAPKPFMSVYYPERGAILPAGQVIANNVEPLEGYYGETREAEHIITYAGDTAVPN
ncbi:acetoacetate decarboxylase family protein [Thermodesulfobacteriota bacterium]